MAIPVVASVGATNVDAVGSDLVLAKPTGVAVGDLMLAFFAHGINTASVVTCSGWSSLILRNNGSTGTLHGLYKVAVSGDVSATNYTFTFPGATTTKGGAILRITGQNEVDPFGPLVSDGTATSATVSISTHTPDAVNNLLVMANMFVALGSASGYSVATDNPTWTEHIDAQFDQTTDVTLNVATGPRAQATATGTGTITMDSSHLYAAVMFSVNGTKSVSATDSTTTSDSFLGSLSMVVTDTLTSTDVIDTDYETWREQTKSSSTWTNQDQS